MSDVTEVTIRLPDKNARGFLRRVREVNAIVQASNGLPAMWEGIAAYVVAQGYVETPEGVNPAEAVADLPQAEMQRIVAVLMGDMSQDGKPAVDPPNDA